MFTTLEKYFCYNCSEMFNDVSLLHSHMESKHLFKEFKLKIEGNSPDIDLDDERLEEFSELTSTNSQEEPIKKSTVEKIQANIFKNIKARIMAINMLFIT